MANFIRSSRQTSADFVELQLRLESNDSSRSHLCFGDFLREKSYDATAELDNVAN